MNSNVQVFDTKDETESVTLTFDFTNALPAGASLSGAPTVSIATLAGTDATPANVLNGAPSIDATGTKVLQPVKGGINGVLYQFVANCATTIATLSPSIIANLPVNR